MVFPYSTHVRTEPLGLRKGRDTFPISFHGDDETAKAVVKVHKSEQFFGWLAGLGGTVRLHAPKSLKKEYNDYLKSLIEE